MKEGISEIKSHILVSVGENRFRVRKDTCLGSQGKMAGLLRSMRKFAEVSGSELGIAEWFGVALAVIGRAHGRIWKSNRIRARSQPCTGLQDADQRQKAEVL